MTHTRLFKTGFDAFEILEAKTALTQTTNLQIRAFAQRMIQDHEKLQRSLTEATARAGLAPPPPGISNNQSQFLATLQSARGEEFDKAYAHQQVLAHCAALVTEQSYASNGDDQALRRAATSAVSTITHHPSPRRGQETAYALWFALTYKLKRLYSTFGKLSQIRMLKFPPCSHKLYPVAYIGDFCFEGASPVPI